MSLHSHNDPDRTLIAGCAFLFCTIMAFACPMIVSWDACATTRADALVEMARSKNLASSLEWQRLLFYNAHAAFSPHGVIDDPLFYASPEGQSDPAAELEATLRGFYRPIDPAKTDFHPLCHYPARKAWLGEQLGIAAAEWPAISCPLYERWRDGRHFDGLSIVFSSFYPDNPPSMFGHVFLRLHRRETEQHRSELLDDTISFAAQMDSDSALSYAYKGLFGGFPGRFSFLPYYMKIQEYSNLESRDLWEYELNIAPQGIERILLSLWEFGSHSADYYYFDDNCSFILLQLLETGNTDWAFTSALRVWATPSGGLKEVVQTPGVVRRERYIPSALSRYEGRFDQLNEDEAKLLAQILEAKGLEEAFARQAPGESSRKKVIDAAFEYIDFKEKLAGTQQAEVFASLRKEMIEARRHLERGAPPLAPPPAERNPRWGKPESWLMLGLGQYEKNLRGKLSWQPVLHDLLSEDRGYARGMQLQIMPMEFNFDAQRNSLNLGRLDLLNVSSLRPRQRLLDPSSWSFRIGYERELPCLRERRSCPETLIGGSRGLSLDLGAVPGGSLTLAILLAVQAGAQEASRERSYAQLGPRAVLLLQAPQNLRANLQIEAGRRWYERAWHDSQRAELGLAQSITERWDLRVRYRFDRASDSRLSRSQREWSLGALAYF